MSESYASITSFNNPRVKLAARLHDKRTREREDRFVIDSYRDLERALANQYEVDFVLADFTKQAVSHIVATLPAQQIFAVPPDVLEKASYRQNPDGIVAVLKRRPPHQDLNNITARHVLALVGLDKPGNIGALMRTADASGFEAVVLIDTTLDRYNPNIIRTSTGTCFIDNIYETDSEQARRFFRLASYNLVSGHLQGNVGLFDVDFRQKTVVILGAEAGGLSDMWRDACDQLVYIPMMGQVADSLNVSVAGAIMMYEALRQCRFQA